MRVRFHVCFFRRPRKFLSFYLSIPCANNFRNPQRECARDKDGAKQSVEVIGQGGSVTSEICIQLRESRAISRCLPWNVGVNRELDLFADSR